jgi:hypothetical protein
MTIPEIAAATQSCAKIRFTVSRIYVRLIHRVSGTLAHATRSARPPMNVAVSLHVFYEARVSVAAPFSICKDFNVSTWFCTVALAHLRVFCSPS